MKSIIKEEKKDNFIAENAINFQIKNFIFYITIIGFFYFFLKFFSLSIAPILTALVFVIVLNPIVERFEKFKIPRFIGSAIAVLMLVFFILGIFGFSLPFLYNKINNIIASADKNSLIDSSITSINIFLKKFPIEVSLQKDDILDYLYANIDIINFFTSNILKSGEKVITFIFFSILSICLSFLILKDAHRIKKTITDIIPIKKRIDFEDLIKELSDNVFHYLHGQFLVSIFLFVFYFSGLLFLGIKNFFIISIIAALSTFIPYIGFYLASLISFFIISEDATNIMINSVKLFSYLCIGQIIEGNLVTPKIMGNKIGTNPVFFIIGTLFCIPIFGFLGIILGTPITIIMSVFIKRIITKYKKSDLYQN